MARKQRHRKSRGVLRAIHKAKLPLFLNIVFHVYFAAVIIWLAFSVLALVGLMPIKDELFSITGTSFFIGNEVVLVVMCAIYFVVAIGLLQLRKWARVLAIVFALVETLVSIYILTIAANPTALIIGVISLIIHGFLVVYFLFSKSVAKVFET